MRKNRPVQKVPPVREEEKRRAYGRMKAASARKLNSFMRRLDQLLQEKKRP